MRMVLNAAFVLIIGAVFAFAMAIRPGAAKRPTRWMLLLCFAIGIVFGLVFLSTHSLYAPQTP